jgi:hypothetical protein
MVRSRADDESVRRGVRYGLVSSLVAVPISGGLIAARASTVADVALAVLAVIVVAESVALLTNWRAGTDAIVARFREDSGSRSVFAYFPVWGLRMMSGPLLLIGMLQFGAGLSYLAS